MNGAAERAARAAFQISTCVHLREMDQLKQELSPRRAVWHQQGAQQSAADREVATDRLPGLTHPPARPRWQARTSM